MATVRPTHPALAALGIVVPNLGVRLSSLTHPLVVKAQEVPRHVEQNVAERILSITDRVWFKAKAANTRGAVGDLSAEVLEVRPGVEQRWWMCAAGHRQDDSPQSDFYSKLKKAAFAAGPNTCSSDFMLPDSWDLDRLAAEAAVNAEQIVRELVLQSAALSLRRSEIMGFTIGDRDVRVRIHVHEDSKAYIVIGATGSLDPTFFLTLVSAIPGVPPEDWMPEPNGTLPIDLAPGEIVWSTMLPTETQQVLLNVDVDELP